MEQFMIGCIIRRHLLRESAKRIRKKSLKVQNSFPKLIRNLRISREMFLVIHHGEEKTS